MKNWICGFIMCGIVLLYLAFGPPIKIMVVENVIVYPLSEYEKRYNNASPEYSSNKDDINSNTSSSQDDSSNGEIKFGYAVMTSNGLVPIEDVQSGIDSVSTQEFRSYDNTVVSGTQVATALSLFQGRDVAVVIQTRAFASLSDTTKNLAINYGGILTTDGTVSSDCNMSERISSQYSGSLGSYATSIITSQAKTAYVIDFKDSNDYPGTASLIKGSDGFYYGYLHNTNGLVDSCYDIIGTTEFGNAAYLHSSSRFQSTLIKDGNGSIIGIFFKELI